MKIDKGGHNDSFLEFERSKSPKPFKTRKDSHHVMTSPTKNPMERRAVVSQFNSPKNRKVVVSISSTANTSVKTKSKYSFNAFSRRRIAELK